MSGDRARRIGFQAMLKDIMADPACCISTVAGVGDNFAGSLSLGSVVVFVSGHGMSSFVIQRSFGGAFLLV